MHACKWNYRQPSAIEMLEAHFELWMEPAMYLGAMMALAEALEAEGRHDDALAAYSRLAALLEGADPVLADRHEAARAWVARL